MKIYLVGGAIRDQLLQLEVKERDWVVVGATPQTLMDLGYQPVGKDFPVFLHPETHEEYALARTEKKVAVGYQGFQFNTSPDVTLEEDLKRRDLTINAIAQAENGELIDPYNGQADLKTGYLRHVSSAFSEDPVRLLRVARFACKLPNFKLHPETLQLLKTMVDHGEVAALTAERVWKEWEKALHCPAPQRFLETLDRCNATAQLFPELIASRSDFASFCQQHHNPQQRWAYLCSSLSEDAAKALGKRYRIPKAYHALAVLVSRTQQDYLTVDCRQAESLLNIIKLTDALRKPDQFKQFLVVCDAIHHCDNRAHCEDALMQLRQVDTQAIQNSGVTGLEFAKALQQARLDALRDWLDS